MWPKYLTVSDSSIILTIQSEDRINILHVLASTNQNDEIMLVFDTYCKDVSLKYATWEVRLQGQRPVQYEIHDEIDIEHITLSKRFLYRDKTKADLADYMAMTCLTYYTD